MNMIFQKGFEQMTNNSLDLINPYAIAKYIKEAKKSTPAKAYLKGNLNDITVENVKVFGENNFWILIGEFDEIKTIIESNQEKIFDYHIENDRRNSAIPLLDISQINARIEPGAVIRDRVKIGNHSIIMMGAILNIGSEVGEGSMIDMNAVLGARALVGNNCHVGAGAILAGVLEPPNADPVIIEDNVMIGANAVILEGIKVGKDAVVAAGAIVTEDVPSGCVVAGSPAKIIKKKDEKTSEKTKLLEDLR